MLKSLSVHRRRPQFAVAMVAAPHRQRESRDRARTPLDRASPTEPPQRHLNTLEHPLAAIRKRNDKHRRQGRPR
jgi:hypothetical protein